MYTVIGGLLMAKRNEWFMLIVDKVLVKVLSQNIKHHIIIRTYSTEAPKQVLKQQLHYSSLVRDDKEGMSKVLVVRDSIFYVFLLSSSSTFCTTTSTILTLSLWLIGCPRPETRNTAAYGSEACDKEFMSDFRTICIAWIGNKWSTVSKMSKFLINTSF